MSGSGLEVSKNPKTKLPNFYLEPNQLYRLPKTYSNLDYVFDNNSATESKFFPILLWEWQKALKIGGKIIVNVSNFDNLLILPQDFQALCCFYLRDSMLIDKITEDNNTYLVFNKKAHSVDSSESITFGIITKGGRDEVIDSCIESIFDEKIPQYEIIVCGTYSGKYLKNIKYLPFSEFDNFGWITKKKNLICESAKYENLVIFHDRYKLRSGWYEGFKKFGFEYDLLINYKLTYDDVRDFDWITIVGNENGLQEKLRAQVGLMDVRDWEGNYFINGPCVIIKKSIWKENKWDDRLFWSMYEDNYLSYHLQINGVIPRFNPYSAFEALIDRDKNKYKLTRPVMEVAFSKYNKSQPKKLKYFFALQMFYLRSYVFNPSSYKKGATIIFSGFKNAVKSISLKFK
ncbi:Uncharacterised protein [uncultured archaeon]|nr:Uncharacterised protein [uncultured archaeon]